MKEAPTKGIFENINDLIGTLLWPLLVVIFFFLYRKTITNIFQLLLAKLELSSKITVGSLSLEIEKTARIYGNSELGIIIKNLSEKGIRKLLTLGSGRYSIIIRANPIINGVPDKKFVVPPDYEVLQELEKNGLINFDEPFEKFLAFFKSLRPDERIQYRSSDGNSHDTRFDLSDEKYTEFSIPISKLNDEQFRKLDSYGLVLSDTGKKAFEIVVKVIAEQIAKDN